MSFWDFVLAIMTGYLGIVLIPIFAFVLLIVLLICFLWVAGAYDKWKARRRKRGRHAKR